MNRQAITFFSLFSLILVLSVYYMMIPPIDNNKNINQDMEISLQEKLDAKRENDIQIQNDILASSASSSEQLNEALSQMDETTQHINLETSVKNKLIELGYKDVFCEIDEDIIKITIQKTNGNNEDVVKIIECVDNATEGKYSPEIKFISQ